MIEHVTPGVWEYYPDYQCVRANDVTIAFFPVGGPIEQDANGHLIAAAKELYEACLDIKAFVGQCRDSGCCCFKCQALYSVRAALAKAEGRAT